MNTYAICIHDIRAAAYALDGVVIRTPLLEDPDVNAMLGGRLLLKAENLQRTGAFKIRGAYHRMLGLTAEERGRGAVTYSSGNHALGLARAAQILGSSAVIVMPSDAPAAKIAAAIGRIHCVRRLPRRVGMVDQPDRFTFGDRVADRLPGLKSSVPPR